MPFQQKNHDIIKWLENAYLESAKIGKPLGSRKLEQLCKQKFGKDGYSRGDIQRKINTQFKPKLTLKLTKPPTKNKPAKPPQNSLVPISGTKENADSIKKSGKNSEKLKKSYENSLDDIANNPPETNPDDPLDWIREDRKRLQIMLTNASLLLNDKVINVDTTIYELNLVIDQCRKQLRIYDVMYGIPEKIKSEERKVGKTSDPFEDLDLEQVLKDLEELS